MLRKIKALCIVRGMNIVELAREAEVSMQGLYKWDNQFPSVDKVYRVAKILGCTVDDLCEGDGRF